MKSRVRHTRSIALRVHADGGDAGREEVVARGGLRTIDPDMGRNAHDLRSARVMIDLAPIGTDGVVVTASQFVDEVLMLQIGAQDANGLPPLARLAGSDHRGKPEIARFKGLGEIFPNKFSLPG
jgi:hypothetical protein